MQTMVARREKVPATEQIDIDGKACLAGYLDHDRDCADKRILE